MARRRLIMFMTVSDLPTLPIVRFQDGLQHEANAELILSEFLGAERVDRAGPLNPKR